MAEASPKSTSDTRPKDRPHHHKHRKSKPRKYHEEGSDYADDVTDEERRHSRKHRYREKKKSSAHQPDCPRSESRREHRRSRTKTHEERIRKKSHAGKERRKDSAGDDESTWDDEPTNGSSARSRASDERSSRSRNKERQRRHHREKSEKTTEKPRHKERQKKSDVTTTSRDSSRLYHSDSELEVTQRKKHKKARQSSSTNVPLAVDVDALYNLFYRDTDLHNESKIIKEAIKKKMIRYDDKTEKVNSALKPVLVDQSSVRSKLIRVLFQRVKDLLKEAESLRTERKTMCDKITSLNKQVEDLKLTQSSQHVQEKKIHERLEVLAEELKVTAKGTTFRDEVHNILHDIQSKYQVHWKEHEDKIQEVQSKAENEIQTLMKNIVGKYVQLAEINKERTKPLNRFMKEATHAQDKPLYVQTTDEKDYRSYENRYHYSRAYPKSLTTEELLLKPMEGYRHSLEASSVSKDVKRPLHIDIPYDANTFHEKLDSYQLNSLLQVPDGKDSSVTTCHESQSGVKTCHESQSEKANATYTTKSDFRGRTEHYTTSSFPVPSKENGGKSATEYAPLSLKMSSKEFWRHKLLQPNPIEALRRKEQGSDNVRNTL